MSTKRQKLFRLIPSLLTIVTTLCFCDSAWVRYEFPIVDENIQGVIVYNGTYIEDSTNCNTPTVTVSPSDTFSVTEPSQEVGAPEPTWNVGVILTRPLDAEALQGRLFPFSLFAETVCNGATKSVLNKVVLRVGDVIDSAPVFQPARHVVFVNESVPRGTLLVDGIKAEDWDEADIITYEIDFSPSDRNLFRFTEIAGYIDIYLNESLDFETAGFHSFTITATDRANLNGTCEVIVNVENQQDTPPEFSQPVYFVSVEENVPVGTPVERVTAFDGDAVGGMTGNPIHYSILEGGSGMFEVDPISGQVSTASQVDAERVVTSNGLVHMVVMAKEQPSVGTVTLGDTKATVRLVIQILDVDDNVPEFNAVSFKGSISEQASLGEFITLADPEFIFIQDKDTEASHNRFTIHLERDGIAWDVLQPSVQSYQGNVTVLLKLAREGALNGLAGTEITFQIIARPISTGDSSARQVAPSVADVTLSISSTQVARLGDESFSTPQTVIVVLVIALILLIIVAAIYFVARWAKRRNKSTAIPVFRRNSKYYVSSRNSSAGQETGSEPKETREASAETESGANRNSSVGQETGSIPKETRRGKRNGVAGSPVFAESSMLNDSSQTNTVDRANINRQTVTAAANRNRCDRTLLASKTHGSNQPKGQYLNVEALEDIPTTGSDPAATEIAQAQAKKQDTLLSLLGRPDNADRCDVISLTEAGASAASQSPSEVQAKTNTSGYVNLTPSSLQGKETKSPTCDVAPLDQTLDLKNLDASELQYNVNQKLTSRCSTERLAKNSDGVPFSSTEKNNESASSVSDLTKSESRKSSFSNASTTDMVPLIKEKEHGKPPKPQVLKKTPPKEQGMTNPAFTDQARSLSPTSTQRGNSEYTKPPKVTQIAISPLVTNKHQLVTTPSSQLSQPNVPPVALALPTFTRPPALAEDSLVITNPVYEPITNSTHNTPSNTKLTLADHTGVQQTPKQPKIPQGDNGQLNESPSLDYMRKAKSLLSEVASSMLVREIPSPRSENAVAKTVRIMDNKASTMPAESREKYTKF